MPETNETPHPDTPPSTCLDVTQVSRPTNLTYSTNMLRDHGDNRHIPCEQIIFDIDNPDILRPGQDPFIQNQNVAIEDVTKEDHQQTENTPRQQVTCTICLPAFSMRSLINRLWGK